MTELKRSISLPLIVLYGLGTILGAGIYVLTGVVVAHAGYFAPLAFLVAAMVASPTAFAYAELSARFPRSAGEAIYVDAAFNRRALTWLTGISVTLIGIVSAATIARGFVGYLDVFLELPDLLVVALVVIGLGSLAAWGIMQSVVLAAIVTLLEISGLLFVNFVGFSAAYESIGEIPILPGLDGLAWSGVMAGAFLAFYAFIGFEDIVNVAEETKNPVRNLPRAIIWSLGASTLLYFLTTFVAVGSVPIELLAASDAPMALVVEHNSDLSPLTIAAISLLAVVNGALVQMIMASRVCYGLAKIGSLPSWLADVNPVTQTPVKATVVVVALTLVFALALDVEVLARVTSALTLLIFAGVNGALVVIKRRQPQSSAAGIRVPIVVPIFGFLTSLILLLGSLI